MFCVGFLLRIMGGLYFRASIVDLGGYSKIGILVLNSRSIINNKKRIVKYLYSL